MFRSANTTVSILVYRLVFAYNTTPSQKRAHAQGVPRTEDILKIGMHVYGILKIGMYVEYYHIECSQNWNPRRTLRYVRQRKYTENSAVGTIGSLPLAN